MVDQACADQAHQKAPSHPTYLRLALRDTALVYQSLGMPFACQEFVYVQFQELHLRKWDAMGAPQAHKAHHTALDFHNQWDDGSIHSIFWTLHCFEVSEGDRAHAPPLACP